MGHPHGIGIVGLGAISKAYLDTLTHASGIRIAAVADLDASRAQAVAEGIPDAAALTVAELLASPEVDTVLNLTIPAAHAEIALAALAAGKRVYGEKPLAADLAAAQEVIAAGGDRVGCAPDTVLGTGVQTARVAIDDGLIGRPTAATAVMVTPGHERWHPNPDFYYQPGGGPLLDMGPYYVTALVQLLGPIRSVIGAASTPRASRTIGAGPRAGEVIPVDVETHVSGVLEHAGGALSTITTSFDATRTTAAPIEVHGDEGSLVVPDPNTFAGDVRLFRTGDTDWRTLDPSAGYVDSARGIGLLDFVAGEARASGAIALHVLEAMTALLQSARSGSRITLESTVVRPELVPLMHRDEWLALG
ncbi:Gfo/Idh/MocA family oxidoreductase [Microbacterium aoyamense]|uniref:Gfo/Idh/MocA family oxidoreductase n=1 Tax=Microbacterium aoyamense TaxID=344166 RepID=A0ABN2PMK8_9MICO|nr:Gfo/Idh/MocA family oxidoreductase [Microbacterium aoyamense]